MSELITVTDCLVFKIEEFDVDTQKIDTTVYILYDKKKHQYVIRGRRAWTPQRQSQTYSFECDFAHELSDFLKYIICKYNTINEILYNYDNLPQDANDITFDFLNEYDHADYEISGYNNLKFDKKKITRKLRMLRNVFNYYN